MKASLHPGCWTLLLAMLWGSSPAFAGRITAELDRSDGSIDDTFVLTLSLEGSLDGEVLPPEVEGLVFEEAGHSQRMSIVNGQRSVELAINYAVHAQKSGRYTIPSISAKLDGETQSTLPLTLRVDAGGAQSHQAAPQAQNQGSPGTQGKGSAKGGEDTGGVFIERECANPTPFVGEQVVCTSRIYHRGNLNGGQRPGINSADFRRFSIEGESRYQKVLNGQRYAVIELKDVVVPTKAGKLELPPFVLEARVLTWSKRKNPFDKFMDRFGGGVFNFDMNFTEEKQVSIKSEASTFDVKPLPDVGKPKEFAGLVGVFDLNATLGKTPVATGDTTTVTVTISGEGLLDTQPDPLLNLKQAGKVYPDKPEYKETISPDAGVRSTKTFRYALVPDKAGSYPLGRVDVPYFNPKSGAYATLSAELGTLMVEQGDAKEQPLAVGQGTPASNQSNVALVGSDLLGPHKPEALASKQTITKDLIFVLSLFGGTPWLFSFGILGLQQREKRRLRASPEARRSKAVKAFRTSLALVQSAFAAGRVDEGLIAAHGAFRDLIGTKANRHGAALAARELDTQLAALGATASIRGEAHRIIAALEQHEFGGRPLSRDEAAAMIRDLGGVVDAMETL